MNQTKKKKSRYIVYVYTNKFNNKKYVGMTNQSLKSRRGNNMFSDYRNCTEFYNAIQKHGAESFEGKVVAEFFSLEEAEEMEKKLIAEFRTQEEAFGYNLRSGGRNGKHSEKTKERIGKANKGMVISKKHKEQISTAN
nr:GIY-YIG nuclease family protein [uncultured Clostridium sp.]